MHTSEQQHTRAVTRLDARSLNGPVITLGIGAIDEISNHELVSRGDRFRHEE